MIGACLRAMMQAGNVRVTGSEVRVASRAVSSLVGNDRMSGVCQRVAA
jgi:hypothetical protein